MVTLFRPNPAIATGLGRIADYTPRTSPRASHKTGFWTASERVFRSLIVWSRADRWRWRYGPVLDSSAETAGRMWHTHNNPEVKLLAQESEDS